MAPKSKIIPIICPLCNTSFKKTTLFDLHVNKTHFLTQQQLYDQTYGIKLCQCGCKKTPNWHGWKTGYATCIIGHNAAIHSYYDNDEAKRLSESRRRSMQKTAGWSRGLTKETDERVRKRAEATSAGKLSAFASGQNAAWNDGLTKETDGRVAAAATRQKQAFADGLIVPWSKGLKKDTDNRLRRLGNAVSLKLREKEIRDRLDSLKRLSHDEITNRINSTGNLTLLEGLDSYVNDKTQSLLVRCNICGTETHVSLRFGQSGRCFTCSPGGSIGQTDVITFCRSLVKDNEITINNRSVIAPQEIDIWFPNKRFGIEYNGLFFHSEIHKSSVYHSLKSEACHKLNIKLFHIFEDEWRDKRMIVESMIKNRLGLLQHKIPARQCSIVELSAEQRRSFFEHNHIDGDVSAETAWGLVDLSGMIVFALSVRKPFHSSLKNTLEIARTCTAINTVAVGGLSKLTKHALAYAFKTGRSTIMTYVDRRFGHGTSYVKAGWTKIRTTPPRFWWTDFERRFNRFKFKADKEMGMTEAQVATEAGVVKIWGCSNDVYELKI